MSKRIGIFLDVSNLYYSVYRRYKCKLNYVQYYKYVAELGDIVQAIAYGSQRDNEAANFITCLEKIGFEPRYKTPKIINDKDKVKIKANWDVGIVVDIIQMVDRLDLVIMGTADGDFAPLIAYLKTKGVNVIVLACQISHELSNLTQSIEIPESLLER